MMFLDNKTDRQTLDLITKHMSVSDINKSMYRTGLVQVERTVMKPGVTPFKQKFWVKPDQVQPHDKVLFGKVPQKVNRNISTSNLENVVKQFNGTVVNGHVNFKNPWDKQMFDQHLKNLNNTHFKLSIAYHGSPYDFDAFTTSHIGTGAGAKIHGWGLYFAKDRTISEGYKRRLSRNPEYVVNTSNGTFVVKKDVVQNPVSKEMDMALRRFIKHVTHGRNIDYCVLSLELEIKADPNNPLNKVRRGAINILKTESPKWTFTKNQGKVYQADIPDESVMIDEQKPFKEQPPMVQKAIKKIFNGMGVNMSPEWLGKQIYRTISQSFEKDGPFKASKLLNEHGVKGISYVDDCDGRCYVVFDDQAIKILDKWSKQGKHQPIIENFIDPKDLTTQQQSISELGKQLGTPIIYFKGSEELNGAHANGITYINVDSKVDPQWTFWHESGHWLKAQHPELIKDIISNLNITKQQINDFRERTQRYDLNDDEVREEIFADNMFDANKRLNILQTLHKQNTSVLDRLVGWLKSTMDKVISHFTTSKYGLTRNQQNQMFKELNDVLSHIKVSHMDETLYQLSKHIEESGLK